jgi:hypothetical protein
MPKKWDLLLHIMQYLPLIAKLVDLTEQFSN